MQGARVDYVMLLWLWSLGVVDELMFAVDDVTQWIDSLMVIDG